jgi:hypothetical protein
MTGADRQSRLATSILAAITGAAAWLSAGTIAFTGGGADRAAALPSFFYLPAAVAVAIVAVYLARLRPGEAWPLALSALIVLPYVPGSVPPAFMLWQGPAEAIVWLLIVGGVIYARAGDSTGPWADPARAPWLAALLVAVLSVAAFAQVRAVVPSGDEPHYLVATQSLIGDRDLKVENNYTAGDYLHYFSGRLQPHFLQRSASGEIYSIHSPGVSVLVLPAFLAAGYIGAVITVIAIAALTAALAWSVAWRLSRSAAAAWAGVVAVFATAPFLFHAFTIYPDGVGALAVIAAVWLIVRLLDGEMPGQPTLLLAGGGLAILPWLHTRFAILSAVFGLAVVALLATRRIRPTRIAAFLAVPLVAAAAWFAYFWIIWGTPSPLAPYGRDAESSLAYIARGIGGLLFDQQHGVIGTAPIYAAALIGLAPLFKQRRLLALVLSIACGSYVVAVSTYAMWWGGTSAPGRFLAALLPIAAVLIALAWSAYPRLRSAMLLLLLVSIALVWPRLSEDSGRFVYNSRGAFDPTIEWLSRHVDLALALPSAHRDQPAVAVRDAAPWLVAIAIVLLSAFAAARAGLARGAAWTVTAGVAAIAVMTSATVVWAMHRARPVTPERSALAALAGYRPWQTTLVEVSGWRGLTRDDFLARLAIVAAAEQDAALLRLRRVPAGEYEITSAGGNAGTAAAVVNRNDPPLESGPAPMRLRLPVPVATLSVRLGPATGAAAMRMTPTAIGPALTGDTRPAIRAARYGRARVFFFDERAYPEPKGFWSRAEGRATIVIDADPQAHRDGLPIAITGGAAATTIGISVGEWSQSYSMTPGERREVTLPPLGAEQQAWVVSIHSGPGFRPFEREPGNPDVRALAAWFEIP